MKVVYLDTDPDQEIARGELEVLGIFLEIPKFSDDAGKNNVLFIQRNVSIHTVNNPGHASFNSVRSENCRS